MEYEQIPTNGVIHFNDVIHTLAKNGGHGMTTGDATSLALPSCNVQMESKKKMVAWPEHFPVSNEWWKGADKLCGCKPKSLVLIPIGDIPTLYDGKRNGWEYNPPRGNAYNEPYRIDDYKGYYPKAKPMFTRMVAPTTITTLDTSVTVALTPLSDDEKSLTINDFDNLKNYYLGLILFSDSGNWIVTSDKVVGEMKKVEFVPLSLAEREVYRAYPILSQKAITSLEKVGAFIATGAEIYTITGVSYATITTWSLKFLFNDPDDPDVQHTYARKGMEIDSDGNTRYFVDYHVAVKHDSENEITINAGMAILRYRDTGTSISSSQSDFITGATVIQADKWIGLGDGQIEITESLFNQPLDIYIGLNGDDSGKYEYGINIEVEDIV